MDAIRQQTIEFINIYYITFTIFLDKHKLKIKLVSFNVLVRKMERTDMVLLLRRYFDNYITIVVSSYFIYEIPM